MTETTTLQPIKLEHDAVERALDEILDEFGHDHIFEGWKAGACFYFKPSPSDTIPDDADAQCLVGQVFKKLGITMSMLAARTDLSASGDNLKVRINSCRFTKLCQEGIFDIEPRTRVLLSTAQGEQDNGNSWGVAVDQGRKRVRELEERDE